MGIQETGPVVVPLAAARQGERDPAGGSKPETYSAEQGL